ncbi:MAG TPA: zinc-dependent peptidase [Kofleriaceae bacterium]|nr:zinc-dependent peptidase [Kofleriaceae bacterium]
MVPDAWRHILEREFPYFRRLDARQRDKLGGDVRAFAAKQFVGIDGFVIDDRVRVHVAATAALLVVGLDIKLFDHVQRIEMREARYLDEHGQIAEGHYAYATRDDGPIGIVQLAWRSVLDGHARPDGAHVGIHELAHALDHGLGQQLLAQHERCEHWRSSLRDMPLSGGLVVADVDGPELFAVASELFFERPMTLMRIDPALFFELHAIYQIDPRAFA